MQQSQRRKNLQNRLVPVRVVTAAQASTGIMNVNIHLKAAKAARVNHAQVSEEDILAKEIYEDLYYSQEDADSDVEGYSSDQEQPSNAYLSHGGVGDHENSNISQTAHVRHGIVQSQQQAEHKSTPSKFPLNRRSRRRLAKEIESAVYHSSTRSEGINEEVITLPRYMSRPPGCSFLGSKATQVNAVIGSQNEKLMKVIIDSGSDITLISETALNTLNGNYKTKKGQKIELIQVTGTSSISGYVNLDVFFSTEPRDGENKC